MGNGKRVALVVGTLCALAVVLIGCSGGPATMFSTLIAAGRQTPAAVAPTDYSKPEHWVSLPASTGKQVDVFYLYPTSWHKLSPSDPDFCTIDDPTMLKGARAAYARQATAFETGANVYAPYYRQVSAGYILSLPPAQRDAVLASGVPTADAFAAFEYYIEHYNRGRPFILAGHSQGAMVLRYLLSDYMKKNPKVYARMVAAYVIGYSVTEDYLAKNPHLRFAQGADDTGVIISYNTQAPGVGAANPVLLPGAVAINPITWTRTGALATARQNLGSALPGRSGRIEPVKGFADARVDVASGALICSSSDARRLAPGGGLFAKGVYHSVDFALYYFDIRQNAADRSARYLADH